MNYELKSVPIIEAATGNEIHRKTPVHQACNFIKKQALAQVFPVNFAKF